MSLIHKGTKIASNAVTGDTLPIGSQIPFGSLTIPDNWLLCDGRAISRVDYSELFNVIGTSYGAGDGTTTFNIPNKKGRTSVGYDATQTEFNTVGKTGGEKTHILAETELPGNVQMTNGPEANKDWSTGRWENNSGWAYTTNANFNVHPNNTSGQAHNNLQPYETDVWIIKAKQSSGIVATVVDSLTSTSTTNALSANQGKVLNDSKQDKEVVLYNNTTGTQDTVTLSETSANFKYLEIFYKDSDGQYCTPLKIYQPNGKTGVLQTAICSGTDYYLKTAPIMISGTSITRGTASEVNASGSNSAAQPTWVKFNIVRVVGYR